MKRAAAWVTTPVFVVSFAAVLFLFDPVQRIAMLFGRHAQQVAAGWLQVWLMRSLYLSGASIQVERSAKVEKDTSYLIVGNHQSLIDIPLAGALLFSNFPKYVSKQSLA
ncbi:MAG: hypothetical protein VCC02_09690, partial [Myxococcota bacterium]